MDSDAPPDYDDDSWDPVASDVWTVLLTAMLRRGAVGSDEHFHVKYLRACLPEGVTLFTKVREERWPESAASGDLLFGRFADVVHCRLTARSPSGAWYTTQRSAGLVLLGSLSHHARSSLEWDIWRGLTEDMRAWLVRSGVRLNVADMDAFDFRAGG